MKNKIYCRILACAVLGATIPALHAQTVRTAYFMDKSVVRTSLNPAFQSERNYYSIPLLGSLGVSFGSNGISVDDLLYPQNGKLQTFMASGVDAQTFLNNLQDHNKVSVDFQTDIFTAGWRMFDGFCTVGATLKGGAYLSVPKSLFEFMKEANGDYNISDLKTDLRTYLELSAGYSRSLTDRLTAGAKVKLLPALAGVRMNVKRMDVSLAADKWHVTSEADLYAGGPELSNEAGKDYIGDIDYSPGLAGFGAAVDLGATYRLLDNLTVSASLLDLGFIAWSATYAVANGTFEFDGVEKQVGDDNIDEQMDKMKEDLEGLMHFKTQKKKGYTSSLTTAALAGAEYTFFENRLGAGLLSSTRINPYGIYTELTASANYRPVRWFAATLSYSALHSNFKTYGVAVNFAPKGFNFFLGSDYMLTKVTPQYIPVSANAANLYLGMSVWL
jgi:hypothetical protein